jgi:deoxyribonuclease V
VAAAVVFGSWTDRQPSSEHVAEVTGVAPYVPGRLYLRELPALLAVLAKVREPIEVVVVDGYVWLGTRPGLGKHLWDALDGRFAVIGVAKTRFRGAAGVAVLRGRSRQPLFVTAVGVDEIEAAGCVEEMAGAYRIPTLLGRADRLAGERASRVGEEPGRPET